MAQTFSNRNERVRNCLSGCVLLLVGSALVLLTLEPWLARRATASGAQFQQLVGGLGMGPTVTLAADEAYFDPRVGAHSSLDLAPVPGGAWLGGAQACSILTYGHVFVAGGTEFPSHHDEGP